MEPGDVLLVYTDGLSEARDVKGEEFGEARVRRALAESARLTVEEIRDEVVRRVKEWCRDAPQHDDLTFIVVKVRQAAVSNLKSDRRHSYLSATSGLTFVARRAGT